MAQQRMVKVRWLRNHKLGGGKHALIGKTAELPENEAARKIHMGFAEPASAYAPESKTATADQVRKQDPNARHADPA